jgi:hypothetical protein
LLPVEAVALNDGFSSVPGSAHRQCNSKMERWPAMHVAAAVAQVIAQEVDVTPDATGMPGGALIQQLLNWSQMLALWGSLGAILAGAAMYGLSQQGNSYAGASRGKSLALGGVVGAILAGLAPAAVNLLFSAARG